MSTRFQPRDAVVEYLRKTLLGPVAGDTEQVEGTPLLRYMTGLLFPSGVHIRDAESALTATAEEEGQTTGDERESTGTAAGVELSSEALPSAVGISFRVRDDAAIRCAVSAATYAPDASVSSGRRRSAKTWIRRPLGDATTNKSIEVSKSSGPVSLWGGVARLVTKWRSSNDGSAIVTVAVVNAQVAGGRGPDPANTLFQVGLRCEAVNGNILRYPEVGSTHGEGSEESEVAYLYRGESLFARGHGAAATWGGQCDSGCEWVAIDFIPAVDVPKASFELSASGLDPRYCSLEFLSSAPRQEVIASLRTLVTAYGEWVNMKRAQAERPGQPQVAGTMVRRATRWLERMQLGLDRIADNEIAWKSFRLANEAMALQMVLIKARPKVPYARREQRKPPAPNIQGKSWRPFQIAFLLASIDSLVNEGSSDRDTADVIWFPTGGGKTEAYLLVSAFELIRRRLVFGECDTATAIISRYTLRFLTAQQFQRTAALVVALELVRRRAPGELGTREFTLGLWAGRDVTPNSHRIAHERFEDQVGAHAPRNPFLLQACPCCGTAIFPSTASDRGAFGVVATLNEFRFFCPNDICEFHGGLPLNVVDESLYRAPPSIVLGTVDKFAQLPWDDSARVFFGGPDDRSPPPSLILQDELHLISGPLGTLAAPYDAAIDTIIKLRGGNAKRVCSTATIRNAREQVQGLYGRPVAVFPPPCSAWDDAFFFSTARDKPGRTYVGVMGQGYIKPVVAMAWTSAALLQSVKEVALDLPTLDSYWTLLAYHNSRRELGRTLSAARDEVQARIQAIASSPSVARVLGEPLELSAQMVKSLGEAIEALEKPHTPEDPAADLVPCTSIISVGVDLDRLGLMLVNGQPKLTSEYIQATSRVGRAAVPGLVVSLLAATKPRDRSHYEDFRAFHESIYRHVEPTSVTPYALPARERTLHAALVAVVRHATQFRRNEQAKTINFSDPDVRAAIAELRRIMCASDPTEATAISRLMDDRLREWEEASVTGFGLLYERKQAGYAFRALLAEYGKALGGALWPTMNSVRNVDAEVRLKLA